MADEKDPVTLIKDSKLLFGNILYHFREVHDLCELSGIYSKESLKEIDTIAITFRKMGQDTATVARMVADQWLDSTIMFYESIDDLGADDIKSMLELLGGQAKELGKIFKVLACSTAWMAGRFHDEQTENVKEVQQYKDKFEAAFVQATSAEKNAQRAAERAKATLMHGVFWFMAFDSCANYDQAEANLAKAKQELTGARSNLVSWCIKLICQHIYIIMCLCVIATSVHDFAPII